MNDPALQRHRGRWHAEMRHYTGGRCPVCGCIVVKQWSHIVTQPGLYYQVLVTCDSQYCMAQDDIRFSNPIPEGLL